MKNKFKIPKNVKCEITPNLLCPTCNMKNLFHFYFHTSNEYFICDDCNKEFGIKEYEELLLKKERKQKLQKLEKI